MKLFYNNISYYKIGKNHSPRVSLLGFLYSILKILKQILPIDESEITESLEKLEDYRKTFLSVLKHIETSFCRQKTESNLNNR